MNFGIMDFLVIGLVAITVAMLILVGMVSNELGPVARLRGKTQLMLVLALGSGVCAFTAKIFLVSTLSTSIIPLPRFESKIVSTDYKMMPDRVTQYRLVNLDGDKTFKTMETANNTGEYLWQSLPNNAQSPTNNPVTAQKIELGKRLFNDPILSRDKSVSCASCHDLYNKAGADGVKVGIGIEGKHGSRNTPTVWNTAFQSRLFWDGRAVSLEDQAKGPIINPVEMGMPSFLEVEHRIRLDPSYREAFFMAFGDVPITIDRIVEAIAAYERTLITADTPYDRFVNGDVEALTDQQIKGMALFEQVGCVSCHYGPNFSAASVFDDSTPMRIFPAFPSFYEKSFDLLEKETEVSTKKRVAWRVPSLRNVALTGPWLHNGSVTDLKDVVKIMSSTQLNWSGHQLVYSDQTRKLEEMDRPVLSDQQVEDIVAFLHALSSDRLAVPQRENPESIYSGRVSDKMRKPEGET